MKKTNIIFAIISTMLMFACSEDLKFDEKEQLPPVITDFSPKEGMIGDQITIYGENLGDIQSVLIGETEATRKYNINQGELIIEINGENTSGVISVKTKNGISITETQLIVKAKVPSMIASSLPSKAKIGDKIMIEGTNLKAVDKVLFGKTQALIDYRSDKELLVIVPSFLEENVDIILVYKDENVEKTISTTDKPFSLDLPKPTVTSFSEQAMAGEIIEIEGTELLVIEKAYLGEKELALEIINAEKIQLSIPDEYIATTENLELKLVYFNGTKELIITNAFKVIVSEIFYWENILIYAQDQNTSDNFFDPSKGVAYSPCQVSEKQNDVFFFITISSSSIQLNNPATSANQIKNFKCEGVSLPAENFPNNVKFKTLSSTNSKEAVFIDLVKNKELTSISQQDLVDGGVLNAGANTRRFKGDGNAENQYAKGDVLLFQQFDAAGEVQKVGFIEVVDFITTDPAKDQTSALKFNCYFQK